jgi:undecaprenyl-diphosphatase
MDPGFRRDDVDGFAGPDGSMPFLLPSHLPLGPAHHRAKRSAMTDRHLALALALLGLLLFAAGLILWHDAPLDRLLHHALLLSRGPGVKPIVRLSSLGGLAVMGPVAVAVTLLLVIRGDRRGAAWLFVTIAAGRLIVEGIKLLVHRARPPIADHLEHVTSWSFPSSHSAGTMMTGVAIALAARGGWAGLLVALLVAGTIGWSRAALGVHWPSDVLAGWGFGLAWVGVAWRYGGPMRSG